MIAAAEISPELAAASRASTTCPACGGEKPAGRGVCGACWFSLTGVQRDWLLDYARSHAPAEAIERVLMHLAGPDDVAMILPPAVSNPAVSNPAVSNPAVSNPAVSNPAVSNPAVSDAAVSNAAEEAVHL